jgi:hypothetical protein
MSTAIEIRPQEAIQPRSTEWKSPSQVKQRIIAIQKLMEEVLKPGLKNNEFSGDYGIIPGTGNKPSLWKSGSEQILAMFEIAVEPIVEDLSTDDCFRYRVTARLTHAPTGNFLGAGIGEASTGETKYKWKKTFSQKEFENTDPDRRKIKFSQWRDSNGMWAEKEEWQVRTEPADLANTVLKMAKKRAQIDATLTVTGASSMFSQDLSELMEGEEVEEGEPKPKKNSKPQASVKCSECNAEGGHLPSCSKRKQAEKTPEVKKASEVKPPAVKPAPKQEGPTICADCGKTNGHTADCKYAPKAKQETKSAPALCKIVSVTQKSRKPTAEQVKKGIGGAPYLVLEVTDQEGKSGKLYAWDTKTHDHLIGRKDVVLVCEVSGQKTPDDKTFYQLEHILELDGVKFENDQPVGTTTQEGGDDLDNLFGEEGA